MVSLYFNRIFVQNYFLFKRAGLSNSQETMRYLRKGRYTSSIRSERIILLNNSLDKMVKPFAHYLILALILLLLINFKFMLILKGM